MAKPDAAEMRRLLDSPDVSKANKEAILAGLSAKLGIGGYGEIQELAHKLDLSAPSMFGAGFISELRAAQAVEAAREQVAAAEQRRRDEQRDRELAGSKNELDRGHFANSDQIIDAAAVPMEIFRYFHPHYERAKGALAGQAPPSFWEQIISYVRAVTDPPPATEGGIDPASLKAAADKLRGLEFVAFRMDATNLFKRCEQAVRAGDERLDLAWGTRTADWEGEAANAANRYWKQVDVESVYLFNSLGSAENDIILSMSRIQRVIVGFGKRMHEIRGDGRMAAMTAAEVDKVIRAVETLPDTIRELEHKIHELDNRSALERFADVVLSTIFTGGLGLLPALGFQFASEITEYNIRQECAKAKAALRTAQEKLGEFVRDYATRAGDVHRHVATTITAVEQLYEVLLSALGQDLDPDPYDQLGSPDFEDGGKKHHGGGGVRPQGTGSSGSGVGGADGGAPGGGTPPRQEPPSLNPITGKPLEIDPDTGEPYPINPKTGEAIKDIEGDQDTMTVKHGDKQLSITEPNEDGEMGISIEDRNGKVEDYKLDLGADGDREIRIKDGDLRITAAQPLGPDGATVVTVRDGNETTTYVLGEKDAVAAYNEHARLEAERDTATKATGSGRSDAGGSSSGSSAGGGAGGPAGGGAGGPGAGVGAGGGGGAGGQATHAAGPASGAGLGDASSPQAGPRSGVSAGLGLAPGGEHAAAAAQGDKAGRGAGGGMGGGMMGGMGGGGAGGGENQERRASQYRIDGGLFDDDGPELPVGIAKIIGALGLDD